MMTPRLQATCALRPAGRFVLSAVASVVFASCALVRDDAPTIVGADGTIIVSGQVELPPHMVGNSDRGARSRGAPYDVDPSLVGGPIKAGEITLAATRGLASIPGVHLNLAEIKKVPVENRAVLLQHLDNSLRSLQNTAILASVSLPQPGMEQAHAALLKSFQDQVTELNRQRIQLELMEPQYWEDGKKLLEETWLDTESAFVRAAATGASP